MTTSTRYCKDCKHAMLPKHGYFLPSQNSCAMCAHPQARRDLIYGKPQATCIDLRTYHTDPNGKLQCGPEGTWWESNGENDA